MATSDPASCAEHHGSPGHWWLVVILMAIYTYAFIDRVVLALLVEPIKADLGASDLVMSMMLGLAFAAFYAVFSIPAGHMIDRFNRRRMIAAASILWALMTIMCGTAHALPQLFVGRMGVGIAEAVITPAAFSLIRDAVPARSRALAFSVFAMSPMIGGAASLIGGSALLAAAKAGAFAGLPLLGALHPWQCTLVVVGICGLPFSLLLLTVTEPARSARSQMSDGTGHGLVGGLIGTCRYMIGRNGIFVPLLLFVAFGAMISFSNSAWLPAAFGRQWHLAPQQLGPSLGLLTLVGGVAGLACGGAAMNRIAQRGGDIRRYGLIAAVLAAAGIGGAVATPSVATGYAVAGLGMFFLGSSYAVGATTLAEVTPVAMMGRVSAVYVLFQNLVGQALGPLIVALVSTSVFAGPLALPRALTLSMALFAVATAISAVALGRGIRRGAIN